MQRHHPLNRYRLKKNLILVLALWLALGGLLIPMPVAARDAERDTSVPTMSDLATAAATKVTSSYFKQLSAHTDENDDVALESVAPTLDVAPPLPSNAPPIAPVLRDSDPDDNLIEVGRIEIGTVNNADNSSADATGENAADVESADANVPLGTTDTDDIDTRSTAFIPRDLSMLSEIDLPNEEGRWIRVDLSEQTVIAYDGSKPVRGFIVSTGLPRTPTVTGTFHIRMKVRSQSMVGGEPELGNYYNLDNVQWVQYFYEDYGFHGTYWHNNFGHPMSHGCINMTNADAKWLFDWAGPEWDGKTVWYPSSQENPGTLVIVHE